MEKQFADVLLPLPLYDNFTYVIPEDFVAQVQPGIRVIVPFGAKKKYSALVIAIHSTPPIDFEAKSIESLLDEKPIIFPNNLNLWKWISEYYCATLGDVFKAALPSGMKLESQSKITLLQNNEPENLDLKEILVFKILQNNPQSITQLQKTIGTDFSYVLVNRMVTKGIISVEEKIASKYKAKTEVVIVSHPRFNSFEEFERSLQLIGKAKKQTELFEHFLQLAKKSINIKQFKISRKELLKGTNFNTSLIKGLVAKKIIKEIQQQVSRLDVPVVQQGEINILNSFQEEALAETYKQFESKQVVLLHGITSSGKTEIYIHFINRIINEGKQVLYLVPEIALTTQLITRLKLIFGGKVGVYHSKLSDHERVEIWQKVLNFDNDPTNSYQIILGARSAVFLPFKKLGFIVVDEEHENTYKQFDPSPRYNARDMAVIMGYQNNAKVILGSATPSFESYYNAKSGKFGLVELLQRHGEMLLPEIIVSDIKRAYKRKEMKSFLTPELFQHIETALVNKEQVILFQNRRGYAPFVECMDCGWIPKCEKCDVSLTYHKYKKTLNCHYCGYYIRMPETCHDCGSPELKTRGYGTEKIEDELKELFPEARIARMDLDSTQSKTAFEKLVKNLENRKTDILIGTQMVTKGLDFEFVNTVGILNADNLINFPDFRAHERSFQLIFAS